MSLKRDRYSVFWLSFPPRSGTGAIVVFDGTGTDANHVSTVRRRELLRYWHDINCHSVPVRPGAGRGRERAENASSSFARPVLPDPGRPVLPGPGSQLRCVAPPLAGKFNQKPKQASSTTTILYTQEPIYQNRTRQKISFESIVPGPGLQRHSPGFRVQREGH